MFLLIYRYIHVFKISFDVSNCNIHESIVIKYFPFNVANIADQFRVFSFLTEDKIMNKNKALFREMISFICGVTHTYKRLYNFAIGWFLYI